MSVSTDVVHRIVEQQASLHGDRPAIAGAAGSLSYRALNARANALARMFICAGLRRGGHVLVASDPTSELAVTLLAVLKAGGCYTWSRIEDGAVEEPAVSLQLHPDTPREKYLLLGSVLHDGGSASSPNLPVMTRSCDVACVLRPFATGRTLVPHATIVACRMAAAAAVQVWTADEAAMNLWLALMQGATLTTGAAAAAA